MHISIYSLNAFHWKSYNSISRFQIRRAIWKITAGIRIIRRWRQGNQLNKRCLVLRTCTCMGANAPVGASMPLQGRQCTCRDANALAAATMHLQERQCSCRGASAAAGAQMQRLRIELKSGVLIGRGMCLNLIFLNIFYWNRGQIEEKFCNYSY